MQDAQSGTVKNVKCPIPVSKSANPAKKIPQHQDCLTPNHRKKEKEIKLFIQKSKEELYNPTNPEKKRPGPK